LRERERERAREGANVPYRTVIVDIINMALLGMTSQHAVYAFRIPQKEVAIATTTTTIT